MAFLVDEAYLPAILTAKPMTDEEFAELCSDHPDLFFEMSAEGELIIMPPPYSLTGIRQGKVFARLNQWAEKDGRGIAGEATTAFVLPNGARRAADSAWTLKTRVRSLDPAMIDRYWRLCPDFVIELRSRWPIRAARRCTALAEFCTAAVYLMRLDAPPLRAAPGCQRRIYRGKRRADQSERTVASDVLFSCGRAQYCPDPGYRKRTTFATNF